MSDVGEARSITLSLRLLRDGRTVDNALREDHELQEQGSAIGRLFVGQSPAVPPTWFGFVGEFAREDLRRLVNQSCGAVLFLEIPPLGKGATRRTIALAFGAGHHSLEPDAFERSFGLRVVLNAVARSALRSLDIATLDATTFQKRIQASRDADLQGFGIDVDRDLMRLAAGSPKDSSFARSLAGKDALTLHTKTSPTDVIEKCKTALKLYEATDYKKDFGFIDYVSAVSERDLLKELDQIAFSELAELVEGNEFDLHITLPDIISPEEGVEIGYFGIGLKSGQKQGFNQLAIEDYVGQLKAGQFEEINAMATLRTSHEVRVIADGEGDKKQKRKLYDCFVFEIELRGNVYVLFGGGRFIVDKAFHKAVDSDFQKLVSKSPFVSSTKCKNERDFISELDANKHLLNLDQVKLSPTGAPGASLEPCDFLSKSKQFIHLKDGHGSAPISHLWNQGVVSAELFVRDEKFRVDLRKATQKRQRKFKKTGFDTLLPDGRSKPVPSDYTVVYGIMRHRYVKTGVISIPFFSKVSLRSVAERIRLMGYTVEVHLVERVTE